MKVAPDIRSEAAALIVAHPGHELLLHCWLEQAAPIVFVLSDGSGGSAASRISQSAAVVSRVGARPGAVFGQTSDQSWYNAILAGNAGTFSAIIDAIAVECFEHSVRKIVSDPVELFNPLHDLANVVAHAVAQRLTRLGAGRIQMMTYPIETAPTGIPVRLPVEPTAAMRKSEAVAAYTSLAKEAVQYQRLVAADCEVVMVDEPGYAWPAEPAQQPFYEIFGRSRLAEGRYSSLITYAEHVQPLAKILLEMPS